MHKYDTCAIVLPTWVQHTHAHVQAVLPNVAIAVLIQALIIGARIGLETYETC